MITNSTFITSRIKGLNPEHDSPVGLIHPYWARKPLNIIQEIISSYSNEGDLVADPFVGSGTTVFAALANNRKIIGSDLNPLSIFITRTIMELVESPVMKLEAIRNFTQDMSREVLPWFHLKNNLYIERERFQVNGNFENGNFDLIRFEMVIKEYKNGSLKGRKVEKTFNEPLDFLVPDKYIHYPINFESLKLLPNSRIAIPNGANLSHYFERKNQAAINFALDLIYSEKYGKENINTLKLLLSSALPLLRLSDKKASSQWPYWRPKNQLTSRNPIPVILGKEVAIRNAVSWLEENINADIKEQLSTSVQLFNTPIQELIPNYIQPNSIDLIVTDPPYSDQAPYLEYSSLWNQILNLPLPNNAFNLEIVKTDAPERVGDTKEYSNRLGNSIKKCSELLKQTGTMIWFYQDHRIEHWLKISEETLNCGLFITEVIPLVKQRRSMKTVTSPGKTLDGDLVLVFTKEKTLIDIVESVDEAFRLIKQQIIALPNNNSYFDKYAVIVQTGLKYNMMKLLFTRFSDIREIIENLE